MAFADKILREMQNPFSSRKIEQSQNELDSNFEQKVLIAKGKEAVNVIIADLQHPVRQSAIELLDTYGSAKNIPFEVYERVTKAAGYDSALQAAVCERLEESEMPSQATH